MAPTLPVVEHARMIQYSSNVLIQYNVMDAANDQIEREIDVNVNKNWYAALLFFQTFTTFS